MAAEIAAVRDAGASGVVIGALTADGALDYAVTEQLVAAADGLHITFHRAIDHLGVADAVAAVPRLAELGVQRVLSSGGASRAGAGLEQLAAMAGAAGHLDIMAGGGVDIADFAAFHAAGLRDVHLSAKRVVGLSRPRPVTSAALAEDPSYFATDAELVSLAASTVGALV
jgi:copper homeostasis protein